MFLPNPQETIRQLAQLLRPGGVVVLQEPAWSLFFPASTALPLRTACGRLLCNALKSNGARPDMGLEVHSAMLDAGLKEPRTVVDIPTTDDPDGGHWFPDLIATVDARLAGSFDSRNELGQLSSLGERLTQEAFAKKVFAPLVPLVGTFARSCAV